MNTNQKRRNNSDKIINAHCDELIDITITHDIQILNGRTCGDYFGKKTYFCTKGSSGIDYIITSKGIQDNILEFKVLPFTIYSDHRPIATRFRSNATYTTNINEYTFNKFPNRFKWSDDSRDSFQRALYSDDIAPKLLELANLNPTNNEMESITINDKFIETVIAASELSLEKTKYMKKPPHKKWFNRQCALAKRKLQKTIRRMNKSVNNQHLRDEYFAAKKIYKNLLINSKLTYRSNLNKNIENGKITDWKNFKLLKQT